MAQRLGELKQQRKEEKTAHVNQAVDRKFKMETDELRKEETKFMIAGCQLEREKQLMDKRAKLEQAIQEEQVYAKLWMLDHQKKHQREVEEAATKAQKVKETMGVLDWQNSQKQAVRQVDQERKLKEQEMLKQQWEIEVAAEKEADR